MHFSKNLKYLKQKKGIKSVDLAKEIGISPQTLNEWLSGRSPRDLAAVRRCAKYFEISLEEMIFGEDKCTQKEITLTEQTLPGVYEIVLRRKRGFESD